MGIVDIIQSKYLLTVLSVTTFQIFCHPENFQSNFIIVWNGSCWCCRIAADCSNCCFYFFVLFQASSKIEASQGTATFALKSQFMWNCNLKPCRLMALLASIKGNICSCYIRNHKVVTLTMYFLANPANVLPWLPILLYILYYLEQHMALLLHRMFSIFIRRRK